MNVDHEIKLLVTRVRDMGKQIRWLKKHRQELEPLPEGSICGGRLDFDHLEHAEVIKVVRALGGRWVKKRNDLSTANGVEARVDYDSKIDGVDVKCWAGKPPPSCRLVEIEEDVPEVVIPAHKKKVFKMICTGQSEPVADAIARAVTNNNQQASA